MPFQLLGKEIGGANSLIDWHLSHDAPDLFEVLTVHWAPQVHA